MLKEFKTFISRGNVVDLAVAVVIGAAFATVVASFVDGIINPIIGLVGGDDLSRLGITLKDASGAGPAVVLQYGLVLSALINFLLVAAAIFFIVVKPLNVLAERRKRGTVPAEEAPELSDEALLLTEIRDLLRTQQPLA
jgi:large conductance mechanosensitive channel